MGATEGCNDGLGLGPNVGLAIVGDIVVGDTVGIAVWSGVGDIVVGDTVAAVGSSVGKGLTEYAFTVTSGELQVPTDMKHFDITSLLQYPLPPPPPPPLPPVPEAPPYHPPPPPQPPLKMSNVKIQEIQKEDYKKSYILQATDAIDSSAMNCITHLVPPKPKVPPPRGFPAAIPPAV